VINHGNTLDRSGTVFGREQVPFDYLDSAPLRRRVQKALNHVAIAGGSNETPDVTETATDELGNYTRADKASGPRNQHLSIHINDVLRLHQSYSVT
jgi:hypothetical protein